jgi:hypothetical protein
MKKLLILLVLMPFIALSQTITLQVEEIGYGEDTTVTELEYLIPTDGYHTIEWSDKTVRQNGDFYDATFGIIQESVTSGVDNEGYDFTVFTATADYKDGSDLDPFVFKIRNVGNKFKYHVQVYKYWPKGGYTLYNCTVL